MPVLARLRLGSIGCSNARFDPLDLRFVGDDLRLRHTLLWLRNGGGKSSLIALTLLMLNPRSVGSTLGKTSKGDPKVESDYVQRNETGIVLAEWLPDHPTPGRPRVHVTFMTLQRGEEDGLGEKAFVAATLPAGLDPADVFELHQLRPVSERAGHGALGRDALLKRARKLQQEQPDWDVWPVSQHEPGKWEERLRSIGLDPGLAQLLARMNLEEGDLAKALTFSSADEFITQTARLLSPPGDVVRDLHRGLGAWATDYRDRAEKRSAQEELARVRPFWQTLVERARERRTAALALVERAVDARALKDGIEAAQELVTRGRDDATGELARARAQRAVAAEELARLVGELGALELVHARFELARSSTRVAKAVEDEREARKARALARALLPALRLANAERRLDALRRERQAKRAETAGDARRRDALACGLAEHYERISRAAGEEERAAQEAERRAKDAGTAARQAETEAQRILTTDQVRRATIGEQFATARREVASLVTDGLLRPDEDLAAGTERARAVVAALDEELATAAQGRTEAESTAREAAARVADARRRMEGLAREKKTAEEALALAQRVCAELTARAVAAQLPDLAELRLPQDGEQTLEKLASACRIAVTRQLEETTRLAGLEETCRSLTEQDGLPPARDVRRVAGAAAGLEPALDYVRRNFGSNAEEALQRTPGLGHGVVAGTAAALGRAREELAGLELDLDTPVPIYLASSLAPTTHAQLQGSTPETIVGLSPHVSSDARGQLLERRLEERERVRKLKEELAGRVKRLEALQRDLTDGLARHGVERQGALRANLAGIDAQLVEVAQLVVSEEERRRAALARQKTLGADIERGQGERKRLQGVERRITAAYDKHDDVLRDGPGRIAQLDGELVEHERVLSARRDEHEQANTDRERATADRTKATERRREADREARRLRALAEDPDVAALDVAPDRRAVVEAELEALHARLVSSDQELEHRARSLRADIDALSREVEAEAGGPDLAALVRSSLPLDIDEERARVRAGEEDRALEARVADLGAAREAEKRVRDREKKAKAATSRLEGVARDACERLLTAPPDAVVVEASLASAPTRRQAAEAAVNATSQAEARAMERVTEATALTERWERLVAAVRDTWDVVAKGPDADGVVRTVRGIVKEGRNAQVVLDPGKQVKALERDADAVRRDVQTLRRSVEKAEATWLSAAGEAAITADRSTSSWVRNFVTLRQQAAAPDADARARLLGGRADDDLTLIDRELEDLAQQLADIVQTQRTLAQQVGQHALDLAQRIKGLERASVLPPGLGRWSNEQFLKVDLPMVKDLEELTRVLERVLAEWADKSLPTQRDLIADALTRGLTARPGVTMPKADRFDRFRRRPIQQLGKDSGGEALTAAFILFCVLARVVTSSRAERRVSLALIDNPLGTANRFDFVEAQCRVAAAFGVQYVAASGITDVAAVERFERLITLTNPSQARVQVQGITDQDAGRPIQAVSAARGDVLTPSGAERRRWAGEEP